MVKMYVLATRLNTKPIKKNNNTIIIDHDVENAQQTAKTILNKLDINDYDPSTSWVIIIKNPTQHEKKFIEQVKGGKPGTYDIIGVPITITNKTITIIDSNDYTREYNIIILNKTRVTQ